MSQTQFKFAVLEDFESASAQNDRQRNELQEALLAERNKLQLLAEQMQEARKEAFKEGYGRGTVRGKRMTSEDYAMRLQELIDQILTLEQSNNDALTDMSHAYANMVFDIISTLLPDYAPQLVQDDFFHFIHMQMTQRAQSPLVIRASSNTTMQIQERAVLKNVQLPVICIDDDLRDGDIMVDRGQLRYHGSAYDFLTSAVQCLKRYLNTDGESANEQQ